MATIPHEPAAGRDVHGVRLAPTEMWASLAIVTIWLAVLFDAIYGPDIVTSSSGGSDSATIPSAVVVALFAFLATWPVAKYGFKHDDERSSR
jgi:hypothetical protein